MLQENQFPHPSLLCKVSLVPSVLGLCCPLPPPAKPATSSCALPTLDFLTSLPASPLYSRCSVLPLPGYTGPWGQCRIISPKSPLSCKVTPSQPVGLKTRVLLGTLVLHEDESLTKTQNADFVFHSVLDALRDGPANGLLGIAVIIKTDLIIQSCL